MKIITHEASSLFTTFESPELPDFVVLTGKNGAGKSQLLQLINGSLRYNLTTGRVSESGGVTGDFPNGSLLITFEEINVKSDNSPDTFYQLKKYLPFRAKQKAIPPMEEYVNSLFTEITQYFNITKDRLTEKEVNQYALLKKTLFHPDAISNRISNIIGRYIDIKYENMKNLGMSKFGKQVEFLKPEEFNQKYPNPFYLINEALDKVELGYQLKPDDFDKYEEFDCYKPICINKNNEEVPIIRLSSGEKILFWLALSIFDIQGKYKSEEPPSLLLLDEVDAGLHPSMIKKLISVIQEYFLLKGIKVILTTHSPTTVTLSPEESIFVMKREGNSTSIEKSNKKEALNILTEGFVTLETGIELISSEKKLVIITEGNNIEYIEKATDLFDNNLKDNFHVVNELKSKSGKDQLKVYYDFLIQLPLKNKFLFVLDCDIDTFKFQDNDKVEIFKFNKQQSKISNGIENLFPENLFSEDFYNKKSKKDGGTLTELNKNKIKNHILENGTKEDFKNFKPLIDKIKKLLSEK